MVRKAQPVILLLAASRKKCIVEVIKSLETDDVNVRGQDGKNPSMYLFETPINKKNYRDIKIIWEVFISKGADVNCHDCYDNTVLHLITNLLHRVQKTDDKKLVMPIIELLIKSGADPSIKNIYGETCYEIAYKSGARKVGDFLNFNCRDCVDGRAQKQQPEFVHQHIYENIENGNTFSPYNESIYPVYTNHDYDYYANATAPPM